ncbi:hypothetical protein QEN19_001279 [Hanseniaspora menglaensis]
MTLNVSHSCLVPLESKNKHTSVQIFDKNSHTFPKGNIQVIQDIDIKSFLNSDRYESKSIRYCNSCHAIKDSIIVNNKWYCGYCNDVNYDPNLVFDSLTNQNFYSDITSTSIELNTFYLFILDYCINDIEDIISIKAFNNHLKTVLDSTDLVNFVLILPDGEFLTLNSERRFFAFDKKSSIDFLSFSILANRFDWEELQHIADNCIHNDSIKKRVKRQFPLDLLYNHFSAFENCFVKTLYHQIGPVTSKEGKIVSSDKKNLLRKFDDNRFNRQSYNLSKAAFKYYKKSAEKWSKLNEKNVYINFALFACSLDDIGAMELSPLFRVFNHLDSYDCELNTNKLIYNLKKWYTEDSFKLIEFESFSSSDLFNISGIWGSSSDYQKMPKLQRNYNKKPVDDLYVKNLVKTDHIKLLSTNSLHNSLNMAYNFKLVRDKETDDGIISEDMLQLKSGIKPKSLNMYPDKVNLQTIIKFIHNGKFYLKRSSKVLPVSLNLKNLIIDTKVLLSQTIKKFMLTTTPLIINDIHNIALFMEQYQTTLTTQLIRDYLKLDFLTCLDVDLETLLLAFFNMKYVLPITNVVQMTPDEFIINCSRFIGSSSEENMLDIIPKEQKVCDAHIVELSDFVYIVYENEAQEDQFLFKKITEEARKPILLIKNDSTRRHLSNQIDFTVFDKNHTLLVNLEKFKFDMINRSTL